MPFKTPHGTIQLHRFIRDRLSVPHPLYNLFNWRHYVLLNPANERIYALSVGADFGEKRLDVAVFRIA